MADEKASTPPKSAQQPRATQSSAPDATGDERSYTHEELIESARALFDVSPLTVQGALADVNRKTLTAAAAKKSIDQFLGRDERIAETEQTA